MRPTRRQFMHSMIAGSSLATMGVDLAIADVPSGQSRTPSDEPYWHWIAQQFLTNPKYTYMNTGTRGPSPRQVIKAQFEAIQAYDTDRLSYAKYVDSTETRALLRARLANFVGCSDDEIALTNNTTEGMAFGTLGLDLRAGDEIIYTNHDHSGGAQPVNLACARFGARAVVVDLSGTQFHPPESEDVVVEAFAAAITPRTKLISFCHVNYTDGCCLPVKKICALAREKGILTLVDGAHPPGMLDLDIGDLGCDMYAGAGHKWLLAGMLTGFFYVRRDVLDRVWPLVYSGPVSGQSMYHEPVEDTAYNRQAKTAARYEMRGSKNFAGAASLRAALDFHEAITPAAIEQRIHFLATKARTALREVPGVQVYVSDDPALSAGLVPFVVNGVPPKTINTLLWDRHGIYIRDVTHAEINWAVNRASLHIMVDAQQVSNFVEAVAEIAREHHA
jgi:isopenicillin-N epimerase